jgi:3-hydroxy acid dehydrogenase/malonic semialdehyde reductase
MMKELYDTPIRVTEIQPGMVETCESARGNNSLSSINLKHKTTDSSLLQYRFESLAFSITRFRGDEQAAKKVYEGFQPLTAEDVAEDIVWAASRKDHM